MKRIYAQTLHLLADKLLWMALALRFYAQSVGAKR